MTNSSRGQKGQVAIFVALVFQVFFVFFAMVVNVGLLVFHKINLQNSVDLAAYYAGMKQAEVLNAIAHSNYQMRQSWKLLNFRYRAIGMAGNQKANLPLYCAAAYSPGACTPRPDLIVRENESFNPTCLPSFCANYQSWRDMGPEENYCRANCDNPADIRVPGIPNSSSWGGALTVFGLPGLAAQAIQLSEIAVSQTRARCRQAAVRNWITLGSYIYGYKWDMANRKLLINALASGLSIGENDLIDLDGGSVREGALKTFEKNLTLPNRDSIQGNTGAFTLTNSLALGGCGMTSTGPKAHPNWLQPILVRPNFRYLDADCGSSDRDPITPKYFFFSDSFTEASASMPNLAFVKNSIGEELFNQIGQIAYEPLDFSSPEQTFWASTTGYEKNPWCMAYVQIEAQSTPKIPFAPLGRVTLKASAIAKPFGGNIGPWYARSWAPQADISGSFNTPVNDRHDAYLTLRAGPGIDNYVVEVLNKFKSAPGNPDNIREAEGLLPSHSRFVGDPGGLSSSGTLATWLDGIYRATLPMGNDLNNERRFNARYWLKYIEDAHLTGDVLPWNFEANAPANPVRKLEIEAIVPDQFDMAYYSIESNFYDNYVLRLRENQRLVNIIRQEAGNSPLEAMIRGDLGYRHEGEGNLSRYSIKHQLEEARSNRADSANPRWMAVNPTTRNIGVTIPGLGYLIKNENDQAPFNLLTRWHVTTPGDYTFKPEIFGQCRTPVPQAGGNANPKIEATPGDCVSGGRAGYSVKFVDPQFLNQPQDLGGGAGNGRIRNPPRGY